MRQLIAELATMVLGDQVQQPDGADQPPLGARLDRPADHLAGLEPLVDPGKGILSLS
jgi:hypothetical protein